MIMKCGRLVIIGVISAIVLIGSNYTLAASDLLYPFEQHGKWGFIDINGNIIIQPKYNFVECFSEGLALAAVLDDSYEDKKLYGFINSTGEWVIEPELSFARTFSDGLAVVEFSPGECAFINVQGEIVIPLKDCALSFSEGVAAAFVSPEGGMGFIDKTGKWVIEPVYGLAESFSEGYACVNLNHKYGYINKSGAIVIEPQFFQASSFHEGLAWVQPELRVGYYINTVGKRVEELNFPYIGKYFSEEVTFASIDKKHYGYINSKGDWILQPKYTKAENFSEGLAFVKIEDKCYFIDKKGEIKIALEGVTSCAEGFKNGIARVNRGRQEVFINKEGDIVFIP